jgi:hypothetical protein
MMSAHDDPFREVSIASENLSTAVDRWKKIESALVAQEALVLELSDAEAAAHAALRAAATNDAIDGTTTADPQAARDATFAYELQRNGLEELERLHKEARRAVGLPAEVGGPDPPRSPIVVAYDDAKRDVARPLVPVLEREITEAFVRIAPLLKQWGEVCATAYLNPEPQSGKLQKILRAQSIDPATLLRVTSDGAGVPADERQLRALYAVYATQLDMAAAAT